ncbi:MAG TPA: hypothetical protein PLX31_00825 [Gemmatimonadaceae bacterium]|mgnify:CR=1 FL=1|nr:hypothetical protein [Gemmatimonadaceae bacterium]
MTNRTYPHTVVATITDDVGPIDRGAKYEDPLDAVLQQAGLGAVCGGGSQMDASRKIAFVDIEVELADTDRALELLRVTLKRLGAPAGSVLTFSRDGVMQVIAIDTGEPATAPNAGTSAMSRRLLDIDEDDEGDEGDEDYDRDAFEPHYDDALVRQTADRLLASYRTLFVDAYPLGPINRDAYQPEVFEWYDAMTASLASRGFSPLGDLKIVKDAAKPEPGAGPFARRFVSNDHVHRIDLFQMKGAADAPWTRVVNIVAELSDGRFVWTSTAPPRWNTPDHVLLEYIPGDTPVEKVLDSHVARLGAHLTAKAGATTVRLETLAEVLASENRCQARTAAFRRAQGVPSVDELVRLGSERTLATLTHRAMHETVFGGAPAVPTDASEWHVTSVDLPKQESGAMSYPALIEFALDQGTAQVAEVGSPLNPFLVTETGRAHFFVSLKGDGDPMEIALKTLRAEAKGASACALVLDSRITMRDGKKTDAIVVMASRRDGSLGETWAQGYRPKGLFRSFKVLPMREQVATSKNLFTEAEAVGGQA